MTIAQIRARLQRLKDARAPADDVRTLSSDELWQQIVEAFDRGAYANTGPSDRALLETVLAQATTSTDVAKAARAQAMLQTLRSEAIR